MLSATCDNLDAFVWGAYNHATDKINEIEGGIGYSIIFNNLFVRFGIERWEYTEKGGHNNVGDLTIGYNGFPLDFSINVTQILDGKGTQVIGNIFKSFDIAKIAEIKIAATPSIKSIYLDQYFGSSGHVNNVYGLAVIASKGKTNVEVFINKHDGKQKLGSATQFGLNLGYKY